MITATTASEQETHDLGAQLAHLLNPGDVVLLIGGLGAGKTTLVKGIAQGLGCLGEVTSPTFTIRHNYPGRIDLVHADLWRLERTAELYDLAFEEELEQGSVVVAEWGEAAESLFADQALVIKLDPGESPNERAVSFVLPESWASRSKELTSVVGAG